MKILISSYMTCEGLDTESEEGKEDLSDYSIVISKEEFAQLDAGLTIYRGSLQDVRSLVSINKIISD